MLPIHSWITENRPESPWLQPVDECAPVASAASVAYLLANFVAARQNR